jgi:hypothetical protein
MKLLKSRQFNTQKTASIVFLVFTVALISYYYRLGGTRDFGLYTRAGEAFLNGENAYETQYWRSGSFGSSAVWVLFGLWPKALLPFLYQVVTYVGFWSFAKYIGLPKNKTYWAFGFVLFLSPVREVVNNLQITGLVLGLMSLSLASPPKILARYHKSYLLLQATALAISLDLKPHSVAFVLFLLFIKGNKRTVILFGVLIAALGHAALDVINGEILEIAWVKGLSNLGNASGENGESTSPWKLIDYLSGGEIETSNLSLCAILLVLGYGVVRAKKLENLELIYLGLLASSLMTYMHYYDLAPLAVCVLVRLFSKPNNLISLATVMFLILPREISNAQNLIVFFMLIALFNFVSSNQAEPLYRRALSALKASLLFGALHILNFQLNWEYRLTHALVTSETMFLIFLVLLGNSNLTKNKSVGVAVVNTKETIK